MRKHKRAIPMTITFQNPGLLDLRAIRTFGMSAKEHDNPIGFFGTGLKYALAILLREGQYIEIFIGHERYTFALKTESFRGKDFSFVCMNNESLGFTTELGRNWKLWQAYRELRCNTTDEKGELHTSRIPPRGGYTTIHVTGDKFQQEHNESHKYFLQSRPITTTKEFEIHPKSTLAYFYRGINIGEIESPTCFTYNALCEIKLTEDRTIAEHWMFKYYLTLAILSDIPDTPLIMQILTQDNTTFEGQLDFNRSAVQPSPAFLAACARLWDMRKPFNRSALNLWSKLTKHNTYNDFPLTAKHQAEIAKARSLLARAGFEIRTPLRVVDTLGPDILGHADRKNGEIRLAADTIRQGGRLLISTLFEEHLHMTHGLDDMSRSMQNFLFNLVLDYMERLDDAKLLAHTTHHTDTDDDLPF